MTGDQYLITISGFRNKLFRVAKRLLISKEEAEDAVQEVLLKLWKQRHNIQTYRNVEAYAVTMTKNYCLDRLKSKQAQNLKLIHSNYKDSSVALQRQIEAKDSVEWIEKLMSELPKQQQLIVHLRDIEHYEFSEIAKILQMNETAVRVNLSRARKTLRQQLTHTHDYGIKKN